MNEKQKPIEPGRGAHIKSIFWPGEDEKQLHASEPGRIVEEEQNLGEYGILWAIEKDVNGNVTAKHNLRYVESVIYWPTG